MPKMRQKCTSFFVQKRASDGQITKNILIAKCDDSMLGMKRKLRPCWLKLYVNWCVKMFSTIFTNFSIQLTQIGPKMASLSTRNPTFSVHARVKPCFGTMVWNFLKALTIFFDNYDSKDENDKCEKFFRNFLAFLCQKW